MWKLCTMMWKLCTMKTMYHEKPCTMCATMYHDVETVYNDVETVYMMWKPCTMM